jgi:hypothetical protein
LISNDIELETGPMTAMDVDEDDDDNDSHMTLEGREDRDTDQDAEQFYQDSQEVGNVTAAMSQALCDANSPAFMDSAADSTLELSDHTVTMTDYAITQVAAPPPLEYSNPAINSDIKLVLDALCPFGNTFFKPYE